MCERNSILGPNDKRTIKQKEHKEETKPFGKAGQCSAPPPSFTSSKEALSGWGYSYVLGAGGQRGWTKQSWQRKARWMHPRKTSALQIGSREGGEASLVEHLPSVKIGLVLHLSTDRASLADWAFSAEFQDSGTKKFLFITGRIRLSILVLEKWVVLSSGRKKRSPYCWSARLSPFPKEYFRMHNLSGNSRLSSLCSSVSRPSSPSIVSSLETSVTSLKSPVSFYPIEAVVPIATVLRPLVGVLSAALAVEFFLISSATSRGLLTRLCFLSGPLLNKNVGRKSVRRLSVGKAKASLLLLLELHKKDGSGEKSYPQAFAYRMVEGGRGSNTFRLMLDHCIRDISNELSDL
ncbi:hypothetical protein L1987_88151 [Smallanthus sonchifolius]|nr:hypothetical protein L1987_88151 [Smallanthus sonchifolius]